MRSFRTNINVDKSDTYKQGDVVADRYSIQTVIGRGGFGVVFLAYDNDLKELCVLKTFRDKLLSNANAQKAFRQELKLWLHLGRHPHIVEAQSVESDGGRLFLKMEYIEPDIHGNVTLQDHLEKMGSPIHGKLILDWTIHICQGMEHAQARGLSCHLDLKPSNILIANGGIAKIADFGLAIAAEKSFAFYNNQSNSESAVSEFILSQSIKAADGQHFFGTVGYAAPELADGHKPSVKNDIYAFGIILWQLATGLPFSPWILQLDYTEREDIFRQVLYRQQTSSVPQVAEPLDSIISKCIKSNPEMRYSNFAEIRERLENIYSRALGDKPLQLFADRKDAKYWAERSGAMVALGLFSEAIKYANEAIKIDRSSIDAWINKANALKHLEEFTEAIFCLASALRIDPLCKRCYLIQGDTYRSLHEYENAMEAYNKALTIDREYSSVWLEKATLLFEIFGDHENALRCLNQHLKLSPKSAFGWNSKGRLLAKMGIATEALNCFEKALSTFPLFSDAYRNAGSVYEIHNQRIKALEHYSKACSTDPNHATNWYYLGMFEEKESEIDKRKGWKNNEIDNRKRAVRAYRKYLALKSSAFSEEDEAIKQYVEKNITIITINDLAGWGDIDDIKDMLSKNPALLYNHADDKVWGYTPLHNAVERGQVELVKYLVELGIDVNTKARSGETPLITAVGEHFTDLSLYLLSKGAHPFGRTDDGETALHMAALENMPEVAEALIARGADINAKNKDGETPFDYAMQFKSKDVERILLAHRKISRTTFFKSLFGGRKVL